MMRDGMLLYHGSYVHIESIDLSRCAPGKDFGRGFYLTSDHNQAVRFLSIALRKAQAIGDADMSQREGYVMAYRLSLNNSDLTVHESKTANAEWLRFVSLNRRADLARRLVTPATRAISRSDVIIGKVADDATNTVITTYLNGFYGEIGTGSAEQIAVSLLLPERLKDQYCFRSALSVSCLRLEEVERHDI